MPSPADLAVAMKARQTGVSILRTSRDDDVTTTVLRLEEGSWPSDPVAPGTVWTTDSAERILDVHQLVALRNS